MVNYWWEWKVTSSPPIFPYNLLVMPSLPVSLVYVLSFSLMITGRKKLYLSDATVLQNCTQLLLLTFPVRPGVSLKYRRIYWCWLQVNAELHSSLILCFTVLPEPKICRYTHSLFSSSIHSLIVSRACFPIATDIQKSLAKKPLEWIRVIGYTYIATSLQ